MFTLYYIRVRPQCDHSILGRIDSSIDFRESSPRRRWRLEMVMRMQTKILVGHPREGMVAEEKRKKTKRFFISFWYPIQGPGQMALRLVRATPRADVDVMTAQLWSTTRAIFSWVNNFASSYKFQLLFTTYILGLLPNIQNVGPLSTQCRSLSVFTVWDDLKYLYLRVSAHRFEPGGFIKPNNFSVDTLVTHISVKVDTSPISRWPSRPNLGRDTDHNSTKLVCDHPLIPDLFSNISFEKSHDLWPSRISICISTSISHLIFSGTGRFVMFWLDFSYQQDVHIFGSPESYFVSIT